MTSINGGHSTRPPSHLEVVALALTGAGAANSEVADLIPERTWIALFDHGLLAMRSGVAGEDQESYVTEAGEAALRRAVEGMAELWGRPTPWPPPAGPDRLPPRECINAAQTEMLKAWGNQDYWEALTHIRSAVDWLRRGLEQMAPTDSDLQGQENPS